MLCSHFWPSIGIAVYLLGLATEKEDPVGSRPTSKEGKRLYQAGRLTLRPSKPPFVGGTWDR